MKGKRQTKKRQAQVVTREELGAELDQVELDVQEERVLRMRYGLTVDAAAPLEPQTEDPQTMARLRDLEAQMLRRMRLNGTISRKDLIIAQLKSRKG